MRRLLLAAALVLGGAFTFSATPAEAYCQEPLPTFFEGQPNGDPDGNGCMNSCPNKPILGKHFDCIQ